MSNIIMVHGITGSGKTSSMRTLDPETTYLVSVVNKELPFPKWRQMYFPSNNGTQGNRKVIYDRNINSAAYKADKNIFAGKTELVLKTMKYVDEKLPKVKTLIIDDTQYLMAFEFMARAREKGYDKYNELAQNFWDIVATAGSLRDDLNVIFLHHTEVDNGIKKAKTLGKMIDNVVTLEGLFTIVLYAEARTANNKTEYIFNTQTDGSTTAKSPMGMFPSEIPNDLNLVITKINEYGG